MANDLIPFAAPPPPALVDASGRPLRQSADVLRREVAAPMMTGFRSIQSGHPAQGMDPLRLAQILRQAETGDATAYLELAEEMEEKDLHYLGILSTRKRQVSQLPITVEAASDDTEDEADAQLVRDWLKRPTLQLELFDILDAIGKGYSATEIVWETGEQWLPAQLKWRFPQFFQYDQTTGEQLLLKGGEDGVSSQPQPLSQFKYVVHQAQAKSGLPIRGGLARIAAWGYLFKNFTIKDWMTFLEVYGLPLRVGKYQNGTTEDDIRKLAQAVAQIGSDAGAVIPASMMIEFITNGGGGTANPEMFRNMCQYMDDALSKAVLGQTSSSDAKSGGLGSGQADLHGEVRKDIESADAAQLSATLTRDLSMPMVMFNRGRRKRYPLILIGRPDPVDLKAALEAIGQALAMGVPVGLSYFRKISGIPEPKPGEELLTPRAAQGAQEPQEGERGASGAGKPSTALLNPFKGVTGGKAKAEVAAAEQQRRADAIDTLIDDALGDWTGLMSGSLGPIEALLDQAASLEEVQELLATSAGDVIMKMDSANIAELGARMGFAAKIAGLVAKPGQ